MPIRCRSFKMLCNQVFVVIKRLRRCKNNGQECKKSRQSLPVFHRKELLLPERRVVSSSRVQFRSYSGLCRGGKTTAANQRCTMAKEGNLLIVDDNSSILGALRLLLERHFAKVTTVTSRYRAARRGGGRRVARHEFHGRRQQRQRGHLLAAADPRHTSRREGRSLYGLCRCRSGSAVHARRCGRFRGQALG